jgi:hypothetical protein
LLPDSVASTLSGPFAKALLTWPSCCCGSVNSTEIGWICVSTTMPVASDARTRLP